MYSPKAWVFTGYVFHPPFDTEKIKLFVIQKTKFLLYLMRKYSSSEFSIHCEIKPQEKGTLYLHYHVVTGGLKDYHACMSEWGRYIKYEHAVKLKNLSDYVSKYASKTPVYLGHPLFTVYAEITYKTQLHKFSPIHDPSKYELPSYWGLEGFERKINIPDLIDPTKPAGVWSISNSPKHPPTYQTQKYPNKFQSLYKSGDDKPTPKKTKITKPKEWAYFGSSIHDELTYALNKKRSRDEYGNPTDFVPYIDAPNILNSDTPSCIYLYSNLKIKKKYSKSLNQTTLGAF
jgi:hypothetical protein